MSRVERVSGDDLRIGMLKDFLKQHGKDMDAEDLSQVKELDFKRKLGYPQQPQPLGRIPDEFRLFCSLTILNVSNNDLSELPVDIGMMLPRLEDFNADYNTFSELPPSMRLMTALVRVSIEANELTCLLPDVRALRKLEFLNVANNELTELGDGICELSRLSVLRFSQNRRINRLPAHIGGLPLAELDCSQCSLTEFPESFRQLAPTLKKLDISDNKFQQVPDAIWDSNKLEELDIGNNNGMPNANIGNNIASLSDRIGDLVNLRELTCTFVRITTLPATIAKLTGLQLLVLSNNSDLTSLSESEDGNEFEKLVNLAELNIMDCENLSQIPWGLFARGKVPLQIDAARSVKLNTIQVPVDTVDEQGSRQVQPNAAGLFQYNLTTVDGINRTFTCEKLYTGLPFK